MGRATLIPVEASQFEVVQPEAPGALPRELLASPAFLLARLGFAIKGQSITGFAEQGFTPYHFSVLALLDEGARETQATIADALRLDRSQLVGLLDGLEGRGLIERRRDPHDRRRQAVSLTPAGHQTLVALRSTVRRIEDDFLAPLSTTERDALHGLLLRLVRHHDPRCAGLDETA
jgi:DNA-binding MarR family transcriptional regulator